ncbi:MAG: cystathionine beta-lyase [Chromatocurvus sp.]
MSRTSRIKPSPQTQLVHDSNNDYDVVATPVYHASTVLFSTYADLRRGEADPLNRESMYYGRMGTPSTRSLEDALAALDDSAGAVLFPSGVAAVAATLQCFLRPGDHLLMVDSTYGPTRNFCLGHLADIGVDTTFYDPCADVAEVAALFRKNTRMLFMESPGSATFEIQDVPGIAALAEEHDVLTAIDNTWATPLLFNPVDHGVDLAVQSGTKYLNGHADCLYGVVTSRDEALYARIHRYALAVGSHLAPDDCFLARRGLRTLALRLAAHERGALALADYCSQRPEVSRIMHPALPDHPGNALFRRDFSGASGLFAVVLDGFDEDRLGKLLDALQLFGMGYSWGGFESLALPMRPVRTTANGLTLRQDQRLLRLHAGLEAVDDLVADLEVGFAAAVR